MDATKVAQKADTTVAQMGPKMVGNSDTHLAAQTAEKKVAKRVAKKAARMVDVKGRLTVKC